MIEILDTTLRDGEQTAGVSFNADEKLAIARLLIEELHVNRIEVASARVSEGEYNGLKSICRWAAANDCIGRIETLGFLDNGVSVDWIASAGGKVINILAKGSLRHVTKQLRKSPAEHLSDIWDNAEKARSKGLSVNIYLEDWSNGMKESPDYVTFLLDGLKSAEIERIMLPDTLGILNPSQTYKFCREMRECYPNLHFDFHAHNDYDMAVANVFSAIKAGMNGIHTTVNGLGERCGNAPLASITGMLNDHLHAENTIDESRLTHVCRYVESISGVRIPSNKPIVGEYVFTQSSGVHADGDKKDGLYMNELMPERFGRKRSYALGKTSGKANIVENLKDLGITLTPSQIKAVTDRVVELGDKKEDVSPEDLPFIIADVLKGGHTDEQDSIRIVNYSLQLTRGMRPVATLKINIDGKEYEETSAGDGQYDAFMRALWKIYDSLNKAHPKLIDYQVSIPPGGKTDAIVAASIIWDWKGKSIKTRGIDSDQIEAAIKATFKMLNIIENPELIKEFKL